MPRTPVLLVVLVAITAPLGAQVAAIDSIFAPANRRMSTDAPGCAVGVRHNGVVIHRAGYGYADLEHRVPITPSTVFYTGSLSKQFTAALVAIAAADGMLDLDAPARRWLPELPTVAGDVSIRDFIHHIGGLREKWDLLAMQGVPVATTLITQRMVLDLVRRQRGVNFAAGTRYAYNNTGYDLLATILERATGQSIREFAEKRIFGPSAMERTLYADRYGEVIPDRAMGYTLRDSAWSMLPAMVETVGSGSVYSTVDDLLRWASVWEIEDGPQELRQQLETPGRLRDGRPLTYAWGLVVDEWRGMRRVSHTGSLAGYRTALWRLPEQRWAAVVLCNYAEARPGIVVERVAGATLGAAFGPTTTVTTMAIENASITVPPPAEIPADIAGSYWSDELQVTWTIARRDDGYWLSRGTVPDVVLTTPPGGDIRVGGWLVVVVRDEAGAIEGLEVGAPGRFGATDRASGPATPPAGVAGVWFGRRVAPGG